MNLPADSILAMTSERFASFALQRGRSSAEALAVYRRFYREGKGDGCLIDAPLPVIARRARDGTATKFTQRLDGDLETESVILPQIGRTSRTRQALCISSQVGCAMGCTFCETAQMGLMRNLTTEQIVSQWFAARFALGAEISNIVFMGMGEPMDNLDAVLCAIEVLADRNGPAIAPSRIAISTVGHVKGIARLAEFADHPGYGSLRLAVSINAPNDEIRSRIIPINRAAPMDVLMEAMLDWSRRRRSRVLIEYVLIPGVNDAPEHAEELCTYLEPLTCTVNVIPYNPRRNSPWPAPTEDSVLAFTRWIEAKGQLVKRRMTRGRNVMAACGQLGNPQIRRRRMIH